MTSTNPWLSGMAGATSTMPSTLRDKSLRFDAESSTCLEYTQQPTSSRSVTSPRKTGRHPLVTELNEMVATGLRTLNYSAEALRDSSALPVARLEVFREAFQKFIDEFNLYRPFLNDVKREYDAVIEALWEKLSDTSQIRSYVVSLEKKHESIIHELEANHAMKNSDLMKEITTLELRLEAKNKESISQQQEMLRLQESSRKALSECADMRSSCGILTTSLVRLEEERKVLVARDATRASEMVSAAAANQRAVEEMERLRQIINDMEVEHATLVSPEVVERLTETIEGLQSDLKQLEVVHKQLIIRYSTLKGAIDEAYKTREGASSSFKVGGKAPETLAGRLHASLEKAQSLRGGGLAHQSSSSSGSSSSGSGTGAGAGTGHGSGNANDSQIDSTLLQVQNGGDPRAIIEMLLDQIEAYKAQVRQLQVEAGHILSGGEQGAKGLAGDGDNNGDFTSPWSHFQGLGQGESVPVYLRVTGKVQNLCLSKREVAKLLNEVWLEVEGERAIEAAQLLKLQREQEALRMAAAADPLVAALNGLLVDDPTDNTTTSNHNNNSSSSSSGGGGGGGGGSVSFSDGPSTLFAPTPTALAPPSQGMPDPKPFSQLFFQFLEKRCKSRPLAVELAYNIVDVLKKYSNNCDFKLFLLILNGELPELAWKEQKNMLLQVKEEMIREQQLRVQASTDIRKIAPESFMRALKRACPTKPEHSIARLQKALMMDTKSSREVDFMLLLHDGETGQKGKFCDILCMQHTTEMFNFTRRLLTCIEQQRSRGTSSGMGNISILSAIGGGGGGGGGGGSSNSSNSGLLTVAAIRAAIEMADSHKPRSDVNKLLSVGMGVNVEDMLLAESKGVLLLVDDFTARLRRSVVLKKAPSTNGGR